MSKNCVKVTMTLMIVAYIIRMGKEINVYGILEGKYFINYFDEVMRA
jgi:hypothetical protein